jgi:DNA mismatch endonuclease (patch repair protein)
MAHRFSSDPSEISARMRLIRSKNTKPEMLLFSILRAAGMKFRRHVRIQNIAVDVLIGKNIVVFVDSPFWHLRSFKDLSRMSPYWQQKLLKNWARDRRQERRLRRNGLCVVRLWADRLDSERVLRRIESVRMGAKYRMSQDPISNSIVIKRRHRRREPE